MTNLLEDKTVDVLALHHLSQQEQLRFLTLE